MWVDDSVAIENVWPINTYTLLCAKNIPYWSFTWLLFWWGLALAFQRIWKTWPWLLFQATSSDFLASSSQYLWWLALIHSLQVMFSCLYSSMVPQRCASQWRLVILILWLNIRGHLGICWQCNMASWATSLTAVLNICQFPSSSSEMVLNLFKCCRCMLQKYWGLTERTCQVGFRIC